MSQTGFYGWIREGVKRAVLLGVSDAVEQLGVADTRSELNEHLRSVLLEDRPASEPLTDERPTKSAPAKKRLGRSLDQIVQSSQRTE